MALEIERKFLVSGDQWRARALDEKPYRQCYLSWQKNRTVRIRTAGGKGFLTVKGAAQGITRYEYDYEIPLKDAEEIISTLCDRPPVEKIRYRVEEAGMIWEVDVFTGANDGLVLAEIELADEAQPLTLPDWVDEEVTHDPRYLNLNLYLNPFTHWTRRKP